jgi:type II secretion system protein L
MKQVLFVRPDSREDGKIMWCESGSEQVTTLDTLEALHTLADHPLAARVCLLLPASEMIFRHFTLPKKMASQATAFSWMAEETLIGEVDNLHWTVLNKKGAEVDAVAIDAARLQQWLTRFHEAGLKVIQALPDAWLLPVTAGGSTLVAREENYWLRLSPHIACNVEVGLLPLLMQKAGEGEVCCYGDIPPGIEVDEQLAAASAGADPAAVAGVPRQRAARCVQRESDQREGGERDEGRHRGDGLSLLACCSAPHCDGVDAGAAGKSGSAGDGRGLSAPFSEYASADQHQIPLWTEHQEAEQRDFFSWTNWKRSVSPFRRWKLRCLNMTTRREP